MAKEQLIIFLATGFALELFTTGWLAWLRWRRFAVALADIMARDIARLQLKVHRDRHMDF